MHLRPHYLHIRELFGALAIAAVLSLATMQSGIELPAAQQAGECVSPGLRTITPEAAVTVVAEESSNSEPQVGATPLPTGQPADIATSILIASVAANYVACYNEGQATNNPALFVALETEGFWMREGYASALDRVEGELSSPFRSFEIISAGNPMTYDDGRLSGDVQAMVNDHWFVNVRGFLKQEGDIWKYDAEVFLKPEPTAQSVSTNEIVIAQLADATSVEDHFAYESSSGSFEFSNAEAVIITVTNTTNREITTIVLHSPEGANSIGLLDGSLDRSVVEYLGAAFRQLPGQTNDLAFLDLPNGEYTLISFDLATDGTPLAAMGLVQNFVIKET